MLVKSGVASTGSYLPEKVVTNSDLKQFPPQFLPIIEQKTGVKSRSFASDSQSTSDLAILAAKRCLEKLSFNPMDLDAILLATSSPDRLQPATATRVQDRLGAAKAFAFDLNSVCSGGIFALHIADSLIRAGKCTAILVLAAEIYSRFLNPKDITTFPYFGDGAGAVLLIAKNSGKSGILHSICKTDGAKADLIQVPR